MNNRYQWESIRANNISLLKMFEMKTVAQEYIDLIADANRWVTMPIGNPSVGLKTLVTKTWPFSIYHPILTPIQALNLVFSS